MDISNIIEAERRIDSANRALSKLEVINKLDSLYEYTSLYTALNKFLANPNESNKSNCINILNNLKKSPHTQSADTARKLIGLGMILIAAPEPITTAVGLALVAAGKKMGDEKN
ncbi:MAG: hypothetical protein ACP5T2_05475 [Thermoprotei archaeon]